MRLEGEEWYIDLNHSQLAGGHSTVYFTSGDSTVVRLRMPGEVLCFQVLLELCIEAVELGGPVALDHC